MSRITHFKAQPVNIQYWDYYILCRLNPEATLALQRMEYWDGTKDAGISHAEDINEMQALSGEMPTQDVSPWIYKSQDELHWELMGITGEKKLQKLIDFLVDDLNYLEARNNPYKGWDRKKQYEFKAEYIQEHVNYLGYIVSYFKLPLRRLRPIFYAIEALTREQIYIDRLNVELVIKKLSDFRKDSKLPHFLKNDLEKLGELSLDQPLRSFGNFAEWKAQNCGMESAESRNASRKNADSSPQKRGSNSIEDRTEKTKQRGQKEERKNDASHQKANVTHGHASPSSTPSGKTQSQKSASSSQQEQPKEKVMLNEEEQQVYTLVCHHLFTADPPEVTPTMKGHCAKLAQHIKNDAQLVSLLDFTRKEQHLDGKTVYFGNLARGLNGWLQTQHKPTPSSTETIQNQPEKPRQITNLLELYQMQEAMRREEAAQREGSTI